MTLEQEALELNRIARLTLRNPEQALDQLEAVPASTELSYLRYAVIGLVHLHTKPERKPRASKSKTAKP